MTETKAHIHRHPTTCKHSQITTAAPTHQQMRYGTVMHSPLVLSKRYGPKTVKTVQITPTIAKMATKAFGHRKLMTVGTKQITMRAADFGIWVLSACIMPTATPIAEVVIPNTVKNFKSVSIKSEPDALQRKRVSSPTDT